MVKPSIPVRVPAHAFTPLNPLYAPPSLRTPRVRYSSSAYPTPPDGKRPNRRRPHVKCNMRIIQWILALAFAATAGLKIAAAAGHSPAMTQTIFGTLPHSLQWAVIAAELLLALWLASNWKPRLSAFATITLLSMFLCVVIVELTKPVPHNCGCFGSLSDKMKPILGLSITLSLDFILLLGALLLYFATLLGPSSPPPASLQADPAAPKNPH
jgi:hypothetical protein